MPVVVEARVAIMQRMESVEGLAHKSAVFYLVVLIASFAWDGLSSTVDLVFWAGPFKEEVVWLAGGALVAAVVILLSRFSENRFRFVSRLSQLFRDIVGHLTVLEILVLATSSAIAEEVFFRGCVQAHLGVLPTALLFGAVHGFFRGVLLPWSLFAFVLGLVWGMMARYSGSLTPGIVSHFLINAVNLYLLSRVRE